MASEQPQFHFWSQVLEFQSLILEIVRAIREGNFINYVQALENLMPWMFALDHVNYARWLSVHIRDMTMLRTVHPDVYQKFCSGAFVVHKSTHAFSAIALDHAHEQENANIKGDGGAVGLMDNPSALRRWMIGGPELARMINEYEGQLSREKNQQRKHHEQVPSIQNAFLKNVKSLVNVIEDLGNPFKEDSGDLLALDTKDIMPVEVVESIKNIQKIGKDQYKAFVNERIVHQEKAITHPIKRNKLPLFGRLPTTTVSKKKAQVAALKDDCSLFSRLYIACQSREGDLKEFFKHENQPWPPSLSQYGQLRQGNKAELVRCLTGTSEGSTESPQVDVKIYDGAVVVQMLQPKTATTFNEYVQTVFLSYIKHQMQSAERLDIVWDTYKTDSLKASTREKRGSGARRRVALAVRIPPNWKSFLRVDDNKTELFQLLAKELENIDLEEKEVYSTYGSQVLSNTRTENLENLQPCSHEEADTRLFLHVLDAATFHQKIMIRTVDTDVFVLAVSLMQRIPQKEVWLAFGMGKHFRYYPVHEISRSLGPQKSLVLPVFRALTGCDTVSFFAGKKPLKGTKARPAKSCLDILVSSHSKETGVYWLDPPKIGIPIQGFCDMDTDGGNNYAQGGWTIVKRTVLQSQTLPSLTFLNSYDVISAFNNYSQNVVPQGAAMLDILNKMGFHQIHFYCHKKSVDRAVSIMTKNNTAGQQVVRYFTDDAFAKTTFPDACGSFDRLPEDTSILAQNCDKWGKDSAGKVQVNKWGRYPANGGNRLVPYPFVMETSPARGFGCMSGNPNRCYCDDSFASPQPYNVHDTWRISVR
ncbi:hypothetical protein QZH41_002764 [Actinostola sp. cb2023]|nr:hypothetical protein QZH41_002764 [Actinostola sp. cb2023]